MVPDLAWVEGILRKGYGVASGPSPDYPYGALERQLPIFKQRGLDLHGFFSGTLNIDIRPVTFELTRPEFTFQDVTWTDLHPPEHFSFLRCQVVHAKSHYAGWVYYPHPETKRRNFHDASLLEVIAPRVPGMTEGVTLRVGVEEGRARFVASANK